MSYIRANSQRLGMVAVVSLIVVLFSVCSAQTDASQSVVQTTETIGDSERPGLSTAASEGIDYDPWERFNAKTFWFNHAVLDQYALKPAARVWANTLPEPVRRSLGNAFNNVAMPRRLVNKVVQGRLRSAGEEVARFVINSTVGIAGFFDIAARFGLKGSNADTGQTFGVYGAGPGPYLVIPLLPPLDVRDAIGFAADSVMDPLSICITPFYADFGRAGGQIINERAENLKLYQNAEDDALDLYAAVRNAYLQSRQQAIQNAINDRETVISAPISVASH